MSKGVAAMSPTQATIPPDDQSASQLATEFRELLQKTSQLKEFALKNNYELNPKMIAELNELVYKSASRDLATPTADARTKLDAILSDLTAVTFPTTIDAITVKPETDAYARFKRWLFRIGIFGLFMAIVGFALSVLSPAWMPNQWSNSLLAMSLGLLGAVVYSFFGVLRVIPSQAFNQDDEYSNYARLLLGVLVGWVFYFAFAQSAFYNLKQYGANAVGSTANAGVLLLLLPFVAGYSTRFVIGILERAIVALETALGINEKRDVSAKRVAARRS
jgi:hypothetical protein